MRIELARVKMEADREKKALMQELLLAKAEAEGLGRLLGDTRKGRQRWRQREKEATGWWTEVCSRRW